MDTLTRYTVSSRVAKKIVGEVPLLLGSGLGTDAFTFGDDVLLVTQSPYKAAMMELLGILLQKYKIRNVYRGKRLYAMRVKRLVDLRKAPCDVRMAYQEIVASFQAVTRSVERDLNRRYYHDSARLLIWKRVSEDIRFPPEFQAVAAYATTQDILPYEDMAEYNTMYDPATGKLLPTDIVNFDAALCEQWEKEKAVSTRKTGD